MAKKRGGIGATGSAKARFFHPSQNIQDKWPNDHQTKRLSGALVVKKAVHRVNRKDQIDDNTIFHIVCNNFKVDVEGAAPFDDERGTSTLPAPSTTAQNAEKARVAALRTADSDVSSNIGALQHEIASLGERQTGFEDQAIEAMEEAEELASRITSLEAARADVDNRIGILETEITVSETEIDVEMETRGGRNHAFGGERVGFRGMFADAG